MLTKMEVLGHLEILHLQETRYIAIIKFKEIYVLHHYIRLEHIMGFQWQQLTYKEQGKFTA